jgi:hypothetical protein
MDQVLKFNVGGGWDVRERVIRGDEKMRLLLTCEASAVSVQPVAPERGPVQKRVGFLRRPRVIKAC